VSETQRLDAVHRYDILDTPPDRSFDRITAIAARLLSVPIAIISIVDHDRIWFKSHHGLELEQTTRDPGLCASCVLQDAPWIVTDAEADVRLLTNPLVAGDFALRSYLGIPLRTHDGFNLGTLCVLDFALRTPAEGDIATLTDLASVVMDELELRLSSRRAITGYRNELIRSEHREERIRGLLRELAHRSKNLLAVVQAMANQTASGSTSVGDYVGRLSARIQGRARTHDLILDDDWRGVTLEDLAALQIGPFLAPTQRLRHRGPRVILAPPAAQTIGLALHELAVNALRYGSLSAPSGGLDVSWSIDAPGSGARLRLTWREDNGPPVHPPSRQGFGHVILERITAQALAGEASWSFQPEGVTWLLDVPASTSVLSFG